MAIRKASHIILIFVDGLGVGLEDRERNPIAHAGGRFLGVFSNGKPPELPLGGISKPLDACLGLEGLPQSATGQTALLTGKNGAKLLNMHLFGFPNRKLREVILEHSILKRVKEAGLRAAFINVFRPRFFELGDAVWEKVPLSVTTWVNRAAGLPFFTLEDLHDREAIYQEFTNEALREQGFDVPIFTPEEAGRILAKRSRDFHLLLYEYFRTDEAGHRQKMESAAEEIRRLERFLDSLLNTVDRSDTLVLLTSDHGNIEDLSVRGHTRNPALTVLWGCGAVEMAEELESILDVHPAILKALETGARKDDPRGADHP
jgi:hypothetical protein